MIIHILLFNLRSSFNFFSSKKSFNPADLEKPILQGYLYKWAKLSAKHWRKRYFALYATRLEYFVDDEHYNRNRRKGIMWYVDYFCS